MIVATWMAKLVYIYIHIYFRSYAYCVEDFLVYDLYFVGSVLVSVSDAVHSDGMAKYVVVP